MLNIQLNSVSFFFMYNNSNPLTGQAPTIANKKHELEYDDRAAVSNKN